MCNNKWIVDDKQMDEGLSKTIVLLSNISTESLGLTLHYVDTDFAVLTVSVPVNWHSRWPNLQWNAMQLNLPILKHLLPLAESNIINEN